jgi:hypothetical protein
MCAADEGPRDLRQGRPLARHSEKVLGTNLSAIGEAGQFATLACGVSFHPSSTFMITHMRRVRFVGNAEGSKSRRERLQSRLTAAWSDREDTGPADLRGRKRRVPLQGKTSGIGVPQRRRKGRGGV